MKISEMIAVLEAAKRGEVIECSVKGTHTWLSSNNDAWNFMQYNYRIAPKKEMSLVEELRLADKQGHRAEDLIRRAANRIEHLEAREKYLDSALIQAKRIEHCTTDELLAEIKRRMAC